MYFHDLTDSGRTHRDAVPTQRATSHASWVYHESCDVERNILKRTSPKTPVRIVCNACINFTQRWEICRYVSTATIKNPECDCEPDKEGNCIWHTQSSQISEQRPIDKQTVLSCTKKEKFIQINTKHTLPFDRQPSFTKLNVGCSCASPNQGMNMQRAESSCSCKIWFEKYCRLHRTQTCNKAVLLPL